jgi:hypothetical protein
MITILFEFDYDMNDFVSLKNIMPWNIYIDKYQLYIFSKN